MADKKPQSDPWAEAAAAYKGSPQKPIEPSATQKSGEDWRVWQAGGSGNDAEDAETARLQQYDTLKNHPDIARTIAQGAGLVRSLRGGIDRLSNVTPEDESGHGAIVNSAQRFGAGVINSTAGLLNHPIDAGVGVLKTAINPFGAGYRLGKAAIHDPANVAGNIVGGFLLPIGPGEAADLAAGPMREGGAGLVNSAARTSAKDFARGANPGEGYLAGGGTPALTVRSLGSKAEAVQDAAGRRLGQHYDAATARGVKIPARSVSDAVTEPIDRLRSTQNAPGGTGESPLLGQYEDRLTPYLSSQSEFTPRQAFDLKDNIASNTRWSDPTMLDLKSVRQQGVGRLGGVLTNAVPEAGPLNRVYQGSGNLAERATARANGASPMLTRAVEAGAGAGIYGLTHNPFAAAAPLLMDSVPVKTGAGYLLYHGGRALESVPHVPLAGAAAASPFFYHGENQ